MKTAILKALSNLRQGILSSSPRNWVKKWSTECCLNSNPTKCKSCSHQKAKFSIVLSKDILASLARNQTENLDKKEVYNREK